MIHKLGEKCWRMWCSHAEKEYPKKKKCNFICPLCFSKLPLFRVLSKENVHLLWQRTTYQPWNLQSAIFHPWDQYSSGDEEGALKSCVFSRKAATPQQKQVERIRDEKTETEGAVMGCMLRQGEGSCWHGSVRWEPTSGGHTRSWTKHETNFPMGCKQDYGDRTALIHHVGHAARIQLSC